VVFRKASELFLFFVVGLALLVALSTGLIIKGGKVGDFEETELNASMICLSCIGIE